jgi:hypothetical protein
LNCFAPVWECTFQNYYFFFIFWIFDCNYHFFCVLRICASSLEVLILCFIFRF